MVRVDLMVEYVGVVYSFMVDAYAGATRCSDLCACVEEKMVKIVYFSYV